MPGSFYQEGVLSKEDKKSTYFADLEVFDTDAIFARMICLIGLKWIKLETGLNYEWLWSQLHCLRTTGKCGIPKKVSS